VMAAAKWRGAHRAAGAAAALFRGTFAARCVVLRFYEGQRRLPRRGSVAGAQQALRGGADGASTASVWQRRCSRREARCRDAQRRLMQARRAPASPRRRFCRRHSHARSGKVAARSRRCRAKMALPVVVLLLGSQKARQCSFFISSSEAGAVRCRR